MILLLQFLLIGVSESLPDARPCCKNMGVPDSCIGMCTPTDIMVRSLPPNICQEHQTTVEKCWEKAGTLGRLNSNSTILSFTLIL